MNKRGFSLMEMMVTLGIMGILSAMAVPKINGWQARAKSQEAINALGAIFTSESSFYSEYSAYGSNLKYVHPVPEDKMILDTYNIGFMAADCQPQFIYGTTAGAHPVDVEGSPGEYIAINNPNYFLDGFDHYKSKSFQETPLANCGNVNLTVESVAVGVGQVQNDGSKFLAVGAGNISATVSNTSIGADEIDLWTIDQTRNLVHQQKGKY